MNKLKKYLNIASYVSDPDIRPELIRMVGRRVMGKHHKEQIEQERAQSRTWCEKIAVDTATALRNINLELVSNDLKETHPNIMSEAETRTNNCPVTMGGGTNLELLFSVCENLGATSVLETGVAFGWSSLAILLSISQRSNSHLYSVDLPYLRLRNDEWVGVAVPENLHANWTILRMADREGIPLAISKLKQLDVAHYDSDKSPEGRRFAYGKIWSALRPGGFLISDDVSDDFAFKQFVEEKGIDFQIIINIGKYQGIARK